MATFKTPVWERIKNVPQPAGACVDCVPVEVEFPAANFAANDVFLLARIPAGVVLQDYEVIFPAIGGAVVWSIGELNAGNTDLATVYDAGLTAGQTSAIVRAPSSAAAQASSAAERRLGLKCTTTPTGYTGTGKTGVVVLALRD